MGARVSTARSLVPQLEASVRLVKARRWNLILEEASKDVQAAVDYADRYRHVTNSTAERKKLQALHDYFTLAEQARKELADV